MHNFPKESLERLVGRILSGQTVFFVGAGFSLDSEGNSTERLIAKLIARLWALTEVVPATGPENLRHGLRLTFNLGATELTLETAASKETIRDLGKQYYHINEWICSAFDILLEAMLSDKASVPRMQELIEGRMQECENAFLDYYDARSRLRLKPFQLKSFQDLAPSYRGKALFLETMGFSDEEVMTGRPEAGKLEDVAASYRGVLRERHHVLARLAREGLCPLILTTNYDLLVEGAYRLAGFHLFPWRKEPDDLDPPSTYALVSRVASPADFVAFGAAHRSALLVKIHGCADRYRKMAKDGATWSAYLPSMVFTYREIQNWRKDSWSRDLVSTLLRTRTMVLCGYSGADPVVHDTFRTVYEEVRMQGTERRLTDSTGKGSTVTTPIPSDARAFFTGRAESCEFHGLEILRAASRAAGCDDPPLTQHPNYLPFFFSNDEARQFPTLDEVMTWIFHRTFREIQRQALETDLRRVLHLLLRRPASEANVKAVRANFDALVEAEKKAAQDWDSSPQSQWRFQRVSGWTSVFQPALLRDFALAETILRTPNAALHLERLRSACCYYPALDQPGWAAWGAVIELAIRKVAAQWRGTPDDWMSGLDWIQAGSGNFPAVLLSQNSAARAPMCLVVRAGAGLSTNQKPRVQGVYRYLQEWRISTGPDSGSHNQSGPSSEELWTCAFNDPPGDKVLTWLGCEKKHVERVA